MRKLFSLLIALALCCLFHLSAGRAQVGITVFPGPGASHSGGGGGATATFQNAVTPSGNTTFAMNTGPASATRLFVVMIPTASSASTIATAVFDGTNNALSFGQLASVGGTAPSINYVVGLLPTGTATSLVVTWTGGTPAGVMRGVGYTMDLSLLNSTTPTTFGSTATAAATSDTINLTVALSNSVVIAADAGGNNVVKTFSGSPTMTSDSDFNVTKAGHANAVAAGSPGLVINWTPANASEAFGALVFR